jgi:hypothetical protein
MNFVNGKVITFGDNVTFGQRSQWALLDEWRSICANMQWCIMH